MLASGAACGEAANLVDDHDGSYWIDEEESIAVCIEKQYSRKRKWENLLKVKGGQNLLNMLIEIHSEKYLSGVMEAGY